MLILSFHNKKLLKSNVDGYTEKIGIDAVDGLTILLSFLTLFIHPFYILIFATILQLYVRIKPLCFLPIFCLALGLQWSSREVGFSWGDAGGFDDVVGYLESFHETRNNTILTLLKRYIETPSGNEIIFSLFVYLIALFTDNDQVFLFLTYFSMLLLLSIGASRISSRYFLVIISLIFFGLGGFVEQAALHLLRATLASLLLFVAVAKYDSNRHHSLWLLLFSSMTHIAIIPVVALFLVVSHLRILSSIISLIILALGVTIILKVIALYISATVFEGGRLNYINTDNKVASSEVLTLSIAAIAYLIFHRSQTNRIYRFSFFMTVLLCFLYLMLPEYTFIAGRYLYIIQLFTALIIFKVIIQLKFNLLIFGMLLFFFVRKMNILSNSEFIKGAFYDFLNPFSGPFFILIN